MIDTGLLAYLFFTLILGVCILLYLTLLYINIRGLYFVMFMIKHNFILSSTVFDFINDMQFHINPKDLDNEALALLLYHIEAYITLRLISQFSIKMKSNLICKRYYSFGLRGSLCIETENPSRPQKISQISISSAEDITVLSSGEVYDTKTMYHLVGAGPGKRILWETSIYGSIR